MMADLQTQRKPAYHGAKFDASGHCLNHPKIRLCKPLFDFRLLKISDSNTDTGEGEVKASPLTYSVIRKICPSCGEHSLTKTRIKPMVRSYIQSSHVSHQYHI